MIWAILFGLSVESLASGWTDAPDLPPDATYEHDLEARFAPYPAAIDKALENFALEELVGNGRGFAINALDQMNRLYVPKQAGKANDNRLVLAKSGVHVSGPIKFGEIYSAKTRYVVHFKSKSSGDIALFFRGFSIDRIREIRKEIDTSLSSKTYAETKWRFKNYWMEFERAAAALPSFFPTASAEGTTDDTCGPAFAKAPGQSTDASALKKLWGCTKGFAGGVWDSTGGAAVGVVKGTYRVVIHPVDTFNRAAAAFDRMKDMLSDIEATFGEAKSAFQALPPDVKVQIGCEIVSSVGTTGLIAFFSAGSGSPLLFRAVAQALLKIGNALPPTTATAAKVLALANGMGKKADAAATSLATVRANEDIVKQTKAEIEILKPSVVPRKPYKGPLGTGLENSTAFIDEIMSDAKELAKLRREAPDLYNDLVKLQADREKYANLSEIKRGAARILIDHRFTAAQKAVLATYLAASTCSTSRSVRSTLSPAPGEDSKAAY